MLGLQTERVLWSYRVLHTYRLSMFISTRDVINYSVGKCLYKNLTVTRRRQVSVKKYNVFILVFLPLFFMNFRLFVFRMNSDVDIYRYMYSHLDICIAITVFAYFWLYNILLFNILYYQKYAKPLWLATNLLRGGDNIKIMKEVLKNLSLKSGEQSYYIFTVIY